MQVLKDGTTLSDREWETTTIASIMTGMKASCCDKQNREEILAPFFDDSLRYIRNDYNYKDVRIAEDYVIVNDRVYRPVFEFIKHKDRNHKVPVFLEIADPEEKHREILFRKYYDICLSCREFVVLCAYPVFGKCTVKRDPAELREKISELIDDVLKKIKADKTEHEAITAKIIVEDSYRDEDGVPDCFISSLRAFHRPKKKEGVPVTDKKIKATVVVALDKDLIKDNMFRTPKGKEMARNEHIKLFNAFRNLKFSLDNRHHYSPSLFISRWEYSDGKLTLHYREDLAKDEPLFRYLLTHSPDEVRATKKPVLAPHYYTSDEEEYEYVPLARSAKTEITSFTIEYAGNIYRIY